MSSDSGQKFIKRNRPPRVQISYEDPYDSEREVELPFVMGVMSDLSGNASKVDKPDMDERKFVPVDMDNIDDYMESVEPAVTFRVDNKLGNNDGEKLDVNLTFKKLSDLDPAAVVRQIPSMAKLLEAREQLANLQRYMDGKSKAQDQITSLLNDKDLMNMLQQDMSASDNADSEKED